MQHSNTQYIYNISGLMILHMIFTCHLRHFCKFGNAVPFSYIDATLFFFMAWFFYKSGMFFRNKSMVWHSGLKRLIIPYVVFSIFGIIAEVLVALFQGDSIRSMLTTIPKQVIYDEAPFANAPLWFLISLYIVKVTYNFLHKYHLTGFFLSIFCLIMAIAMNYYSYVLPTNIREVSIIGFQVYIPYWLGNVFHGLALYNLGYLFKDCYKSYITVGIVLFIFIVHYYIPSTIGFHSNINMGSYCLAFLYNLAAIILFQYVFYRFFNRKILLLTHIGKYSMIYYVCHYIIFFVLFECLENVCTCEKWLLFLIGLVIGCPFLYVCEIIFRTDKLKWMVGM